MPEQVDGPYRKRLRQLHLAIAVLISALAISGLIFHFRKSLGLSEAKMTIVTVHVFIGYVLIAIFALRVFLGIGPERPEKFSHVFFTKAHFKKLFSSRVKFAGRSPLSRLIASVIYALVAFNISTGVVRAGTDLYHPPFGPLVLNYLSLPGEKATTESVKTGEIDKNRLKKLVKYKKPFATTHYYAGLLIIFVMIVHAVGVIVTEWSPPGGGKARGRARLMLFGPEKR